MRRLKRHDQRWMSGWQRGLAVVVAVMGAATNGLAVTPLPPSTVLPKLALTLLGRSPDAAKIKAFQQEAAGGDEAFHRALTRRIKTYLRGPAFQTQVEAYHGIWWHLPPGDATKLAGFIVATDSAASCSTSSRIPVSTRRRLAHLLATVIGSGPVCGLMQRSVTGRRAREAQGPSQLIRISPPTAFRSAPSRPG